MYYSTLCLSIFLFILCKLLGISRLRQGCPFIFIYTPHPKPTNLVNDISLKTVIHGIHQFNTLSFRSCSVETEAWQMKHLYFKYCTLPSFCALHETATRLSTQNSKNHFSPFSFIFIWQHPVARPGTWVTAFYHQVFSYLKPVTSALPSWFSHVFTLLFERQMLLRINLQTILSHVMLQQQWILSFLMSQLQVCFRAFDYSLLFSPLLQNALIFFCIPQCDHLCQLILFSWIQYHIFIETSLDTADKIHLL